MFFKADGGVAATRGSGCSIFEPDGTEYLDCANNVAGCGHSHSTVVAAGVAELQNIQTNGRFLHPLREKYVSRLLETLPEELDTLYLTNSGSEANDLALRMARAYSTSPNPEDVICIDAAYHGHTQSLVNISPYKWRQCDNGRAGEYHKEGVHIVSVPDTFRGPYQSGQEYADEVKYIVSATGGVGAFIHESIMGCGGQIVMPDGYLPEAYKAVRDAGGLVIADEVQTGFGRAGNHFWQFQEYGVVPDIVTMGKPMGNGYPIGAVAVRREVAEAFASSGIEYFNTFGGNSVACAIADGVLDAIEQDGMQNNAKVVGGYLADRMNNLKKLKGAGEWVGDVRGHGLFQGIEFVQKSSLVPHEKLCRFVVDYLKYEKIITSRDGPDGNVLKIKPPLVFSLDNVDRLVNGIESALIAADESGCF
jgi:4-aminobutyrate aminotransferase-like enzyme